MELDLWTKKVQTFGPNSYSVKGRDRRQGGEVPEQVWIIHMLQTWQMQVPKKHQLSMTFPCVLCQKPKNTKKSWCLFDQKPKNTRKIAPSHLKNRGVSDVFAAPAEMRNEKIPKSLMNFKDVSRIVMGVKYYVQYCFFRIWDHQIKTVS